MNLAPRSPQVRAVLAHAPRGTALPRGSSISSSATPFAEASAEPRRARTEHFRLASIDRRAPRAGATRSKAAGTLVSLTVRKLFQRSAMLSAVFNVPPAPTAASTSTHATKSANAATSGTRNLDNDKLRHCTTSLCACSSAMAARASTARAARRGLRPRADPPGRARHLHDERAARPRRRRVHRQAELPAVVPARAGGAGPERRRRPPARRRRRRVLRAEAVRQPVRGAGGDRRRARRARGAHQPGGPADRPERRAPRRDGAQPGEARLRRRGEGDGGRAREGRAPHVHADDAVGRRCGARNSAQFFGAQFALRPPQLLRCRRRPQADPPREPARRDEGPSSSPSSSRRAAYVAYGNSITARVVRRRRRLPAAPRGNERMGAGQSGAALGADRAVARRRDRRRGARAARGARDDHGGHRGGLYHCDRPATGPLPGPCCSGCAIRSAKATGTR